jgi:hypothetical protein
MGRVALLRKENRMSDSDSPEYISGVIFQESEVHPCGCAWSLCWKAIQTLGTACCCFEQISKGNFQQPSNTQPSTCELKECNVL